MTVWLARVADDRDPLRYELQACRGIPHSVFMGRPVATVYHYDATGRIVRAETQQWTVEDRAKAIALATYEARLCTGCGGDTEETTKAENEDRYRTTIAALCHRCVARSIGMNAVMHPHPEALLFTTEHI